MSALIHAETVEQRILALRSALRRNDPETVRHTAIRLRNAVDDLTSEVDAIISSAFAAECAEFDAGIAQPFEVAS